MKKYVVVFVVVAILLSGCVSIGDKLTAKNEAKLVLDWNAPTIMKPIACILHKGETVEVIDVSTLSFGSTEKETIIRVSSLNRDCTGWGFPRDFGQ